MLWVVLFSILAALFLWYFYYKPFNYWKSMGVKQVQPWIFFGDSWPTLLRKKHILEWLDWIYHKHPNEKYVGVYQFYLPTFVLRDPDLIRQLIVKDFDHFPDHNSTFGEGNYDPLWSKNLFALKGQRWKDMRSLLSGSFTSSKMRIMYGLIAEASENFVKHFLSKDDGLVEVELKDCFTRYANDVIATTSFGVTVNSLEDPKNDFYLMGKEVTDFSSPRKQLKFFGMFLFPKLFKMLKINIFSKKVSEFFQNLVDENVRIRKEKGIVRPDMINLLLEVQKEEETEKQDTLDKGFAIVDDTNSLKPTQKRHKLEITNVDITAQAMIFFLAGFDTVSTAMALTCYELAVNTDVQDKLREEIREVYEKNSGQVTYEALLNMNYLDMVVSESLRLWPIAVVTDRVCAITYTIKPTTKEDPEITINKGTNVWVPIGAIHRDPKHYPNPLKFDPERFSEENKVQIKPYTYMPFGVGPRACIGSRFALLELKSILFNLVYKFELVPVEKTPIPLVPNKKQMNILPEGGITIGFKKI